MSDAATAVRGLGLRQNPEVVSSRLGEAGVLVHLRSNRIFELNETGVRVWELLGEGRLVGEIERQLQQEFEVAPDQLHREVAALLEQLLHEGLVDGGPAA